MHNEILKFGPFTVYGYGLMIAIGILTAYIVTEYRARKKNLQYEQILSLVLWCAVGGIVSAKLLYWILHLKDMIRDPAFFLYTFGDGFVVYGGIIGGILTGYLYCRKSNLRFLQYFDLVMPSVALAQGFGRIGCFLAGCCYGRECHSFLAITFRTSSFAPNGVPLIPTQLYSSGLNFLHAFLLMYLAGRMKMEGSVAGAYLIFYSVGRFVMEFFRGDLERGMVGSLTTSQFLAIFTLLAGLLLTAYNLQKKKKSI